MVIKNCLICDKKIYRANNCDQAKSLRSIKAVTCSREHSKIYNRIATHIRDKYIHRLKSLVNKITELEKNGK